MQYCHNLHAKTRCYINFSEFLYFKTLRDWNYFYKKHVEILKLHVFYSFNILNSRNSQSWLRCQIFVALICFNTFHFTSKQCKIFIIKLPHLLLTATERKTLIGAYGFQTSSSYLYLQLPMLEHLKVGVL